MSIGLGIGNSISGKISGFGGGYDPDAKAYFTAIEDAGGTLTDNVKAEFDAFVVREKDAGRWSKLKRLYPYLGGVIDSARVDAINLGQATNNNFVDADADSVCGLQPDGTTKYLVDLQPASIFTSINDVQGIHFQSGTDGGTAYMFGAFDTGNNRLVGFLETSSDTRIAVGSSTSSNSIVLPSSGINSLSGGRFSSTDLRTYVNGADLATETTLNSSIFPALNLYIFANNRNGGINSPNAQKGFGTIMAEGMTPTELLATESSYRTFINNIQAYAAAQAYFAAVEASSGTLTTNVKSEFTSFVSREVEAGRWSKIKRLYPYLGGVINSAVIDAITLNAATNNNFVDADVDATIGLTGDGSTKSIIESGDITNIITDDYNFAIGTFAKDPVGVTPSGQYYTQYYDGSNRIAIRRLFNSIGAYSGSVSTYFYDNTDITAESNWSFIMGQYTSSSRSILFNGTNVKTNTATSSNPATGFIGDPYKYDHYYFTYGGQSNSSFISQGMSETELIAFESSYKTFINNITA